MKLLGHFFVWGDERGWMNTLAMDDIMGHSYCAETVKCEIYVRGWEIDYHLEGQEATEFHNLWMAHLEEEGHLWAESDKLDEKWRATQDKDDIF